MEQTIGLIGYGAAGMVVFLTLWVAIEEHIKNKRAWIDSLPHHPDQHAKDDKEINIKEIVSAWLLQNDCDGLCNPEIECGCGLDNLMPCEFPDEKHCVPAVERDGAFVMHHIDNTDNGTRA